MQRLHPSAGIAIGPILFILALLGVIAMVLSSGSNDGFGSAGVADRITADITSQTNMIRSKILECQMQYLVNGHTYASGSCTNDAYPCSDQTNGTAVADLTCPNDPLTSGGAEQSLWTGLRVSMLPPPTHGFTAWTYFNGGDSGGRCFWTAPLGNKTSNIVQGLTRAATKFTSSEVKYDSGSGSQKFVVFVTVPTGAVNSKCSTN